MLLLRQLVAVALAVSWTVADARTLVQLSFVHRHGARLEPLLIDGSLTWHFADLTPAGAAMGYNLGTKLRERYSTFIPSTLQNEGSSPTYVVQSTEVGRTIQTCQAALKSLFNTTLAYIPHEPIGTDYLLAFPGNYPSNVLESEWFNAVTMDNNIAPLYLNSTDMAFLTSVFGSWCPSEPTLCALLGEDVGQCRRANGGMTPYFLNLFETKLMPMQMIQNKWQFGFNASSPYAAIGSTGYPIMSKILSDATAKLRSSSSATLPRVFHYSAHDNTVIGAFNTLGAARLEDENAHIWVPKFAQTLLVETFDDGTVDFLWMKPNETAGSGFFFPDPTPLIVMCIASNGTQYFDSSCPLDDAFRFVNASRPDMAVISSYRGGNNPYCWLSPTDRATCDMINVVPSPECQQYRMSCPEVACDPESAVLDEENGYTCTSFATKHSFSQYAPGSLGSAAAALVFGSIAGVGIAKYMERAPHEEFD